MDKIFGDGTKKHADILLKNGNMIGRVVYYYYSYNNMLIRLLDKNKYVTAQFYRGYVDIDLEEDDDLVYNEE